MKKAIVTLLLAVMTSMLMSGCGGSEAETEAADAGMSGEITVVSREDGSGTRGAFIELFGIEQKDADGNKVDYTTEMAEITNSTSVMMTTVAGNVNAIGYVSLGSLSGQVKAVKIDGGEATADNVKNGSYKVSRPFNIATMGEADGLVKDFIDFILSDEGQAVVEENGYVSEGSTGAFEGAFPGGKITVGGSSSVTPVMEKLKEAYLALSSGSETAIEVQQSDSTTGMTSTIDGSYDIGMASRELKDTEISEGLVPQVIALDGIAVIVNQDNPISGVSSDDVMRIYTGEVTDWADIAQ